MAAPTTRLAGACLALILSLLLWAGMAFGQEPEAPDYTAFDADAQRVESLLEAEDTAIADLEALRAELAAWRDDLLKAQEINGARIDTLQSQIDALGPAPEEGESEEPPIAGRREELNQQLSVLMAPGRRAEEAYTRANGLIAEIDREIRERQASALLELGPMPLNPAHWPGALEDLTLSITASGMELLEAAADPTARAEAQRNLPSLVVLLAVGVMLIARGHLWARQGVMRLQGRTRRGTGVFRFLISLGQILLPLAGIYALTQAALVSGMTGPRWDAILIRLPIWAATLLGIRWLADLAFHDDDHIAALPLEPEARRRARRIANILSVTFVLRAILDTAVEIDDFGEATQAVLQFPILLVSGYFLFRFGRTRHGATETEGAAAPEASDVNLFRMRMARLLGRAAVVIGIAGPLLAAVGFLRVGEALVYPAIATLGLLGAVMVLQRFVNSLYELATGADPDEDNSLLTVLAGFLLAFASLPLLALIWGARVADLTEVWARFKEGFTFGETRISPSDFLVVLLVFVVGYMLTRLFQGALRAAVLPRTQLDQGGQNAVVSGVGYLGILIAAIVAITAGGLDLSSLAIVAGALSVGIGFGLQNIVSNFVSGIILLIERPIGEGDWIEVNGTHGIVKAISVRSTRLETFDRYDLIIPNADFVSGTVANYTRGNSLGRLILEVNVAYGTDTRLVEKVLIDIVRRHDMVLMNPAPYVVFKGFGADGMDFDVRMILRDIDQGLTVRTEMNHQIAERFAEEGIEIPFAQRDLWLRNPEALWAREGRPAPVSTTGPKTPETVSAPVRQEQPDPGAYGADADAGTDNDGGEGR